MHPAWNAVTNAVTPPRVDRWLVEHQADRGVSYRTHNGYLVAITGFTRWLNRTGRLSADPIAMLSRRNEDKDRRNQRRELNTTALAALIDAAQSGPELGGISGPDRDMLFPTIIATGFRESETFSFTPESFELDHADGPSVVVSAAYSKDRRRTRLDTVLGRPAAVVSDPFGVPARMRSRTRSAQTDSHSDALDRMMCDLIGRITDDDHLGYKSKLDKDFRTLLHEAAAPRSSETENTPRRTRTFNPLIKSHRWHRRNLLNGLGLEWKLHRVDAESGAAATCTQRYIAASHLYVTIVRYAGIEGGIRFRM